MIYLTTFPPPAIENPPTNSACADPMMYGASLKDAIMETYINSPLVVVSSNLTVDFDIKLSKRFGEYGKKRQYELPVT